MLALGPATGSAPVRPMRLLAPRSGESARGGAEGVALRGPMSVFECQASRDGERVRLSLRGELDIAAAGRLDAELERVEREGPGHLVLDLRGLTFLDSTGLRSLIAADARGREQGRRVTLVQGPAGVQRVFEITGLEGRLEIVEDEASLASGSS